MKSYYYVVSIKRNGHFLAYVKTVKSCYNLRYMFPDDAETITAMPTKKAAMETAAAWCKTWINDGKLLAFDYDVTKYGPPVVENSRACWE